MVNCRHRLYDVYIGRSGHGEDGYFGNPIQVGRKCPQCGQRHTQGYETLPCYASYLRERVELDLEFRRRLVELKGKTLGCFCPGPSGLTLDDQLCCHGQVILAWLEAQ